MSLIDRRGVRLTFPSGDLPAPLTASQLRARRNEDWRRDHEEGRLDPTTGRAERRPIAMIAALSRVSVRTVQVGIADARRVREAIALVD